MQIPRIYQDLNKFLKPNKALIIYGPRQVGKTTLLRDFLGKTKLKYRLDSGDDIKIRQLLDSENFDLIKEYVGSNKIIAIDEAQKIKNVGQGFKIMVDQIPKIKIIASGSSSFELAGQVGEPLTGRKNTITLYPVSQLELKKLYSNYELKTKLEEFMIFGGYPEVVATANKSGKIKLLEELVQSYLLKDILELEKVKNSKILLDLLRLLAFQMGNEVSLTELGTQLGIDYKTVARYLDLFEKTFIIYNLRGFRRNLRKEMTKKSKYYFYDNGVRNAIISNFNGLELRNDTGQLFENFVFMERLKKRTYKNIYANVFFWRTWDQKEIDLIEERDGKLFGYEFKWNEKHSKKKTFPAKAAKEFMKTYKEAEYKIITPGNFLEFVG